MNQPEVIDKRNAETILANVPYLNSQGEHCVVEYAGLHVMGVKRFTGDGAAECAQAKLDELNASGNSTHGKLYPPTNHGGGSGWVQGEGLGVGGDDINPVSLGHRAINDDHLAQRFGAVA